MNSFSDLSAADAPLESEQEIKEIFQPDSIQNIINRLEASETEFATKTKKMLQNMSPLALAVVFEQIVRGSQMNVREVFEMEYKISQGFMNHTEFFEGVRALLVDKDKSPKWKYAKVADIPRSEVEFFFDRTEKCLLDIGQDK